MPLTAGRKAGPEVIRAGPAPYLGSTVELTLESWPSGHEYGRIGLSAVCGGIIKGEIPSPPFCPLQYTTDRRAGPGRVMKPGELALTFTYYTALRRAALQSRADPDGRVSQS